MVVVHEMMVLSFIYVLDLVFCRISYMDLRILSYLAINCYMMFMGLPFYQRVGSVLGSV
jgi:hypothetical protein